MIRKRLFVVLGLCLGAASGVVAQSAEAPGPVGGTLAALPELRLPSMQELRAQLEGINLLLPRDAPLAATPTGWAGRSGANAWN